VTRPQSGFRAASIWRCKLAALQGDADSALHEARTAVGLADATEMYTFRGDAYRDLAEVAARTGRREESGRTAAAALALYGAKENAAVSAQLRARAAAGWDARSDADPTRSVP